MTPTAAEEFFASGSDGYYGHVDGPRPDSLGKATEVDPFESALGMCRMMGLHYRVTQMDGGKWCCCVGSRAFPADFHGTHNQQRTCGVIGTDNRLSGLRSAISMIFESLRSDCATWRGMVSGGHDYSSWFKPRPCTGCGQASDQTHQVPYVGHMCPICLSKLETGVIVEGTNNGVSIRSVAEAMKLEIGQRAERLRRRAMEIIKSTEGPTVESNTERREMNGRCRD